MYFLVVFLDALGALIMVAILRNFGQLSLPTALFFSLFPLGFALLAELLKIEALETGTTERHRNVVRVMGVMLILITLGLGAYPPFKEIWLANKEPWMRPVLIWIAIQSLMLLAIPIVQEIRARRRIRYEKLKENKILP
ncbi:MAG TPA: hypothetical protein VNJ07_11200 [Chitinophagales bacterium]|nr:hypothetical protein [Chitinophagales bacterium]